MAAIQDPLAFAAANHDRFVAELADFVRIPSVSSERRYAPAVARCARWLARRLERAGLRDVTVLRGGGHTLVSARWNGAPQAPTVLLYGHFDVVPAEPSASWRSPPFEPTVRDGCLYGRGVADDKGPLLCHVAALESWLKTRRRLPVNVRCLFDGEEEVGSPGLRRLLERGGHEVRADVAAISDTRMVSPDRPALVYGLRGSLKAELVVRGPARELHSGAFGGAVANPLEALCRIVASLHRLDGSVAIGGFYRRVRPAAPEERRRLRRQGPSERDLMRQASALASWGERGYSAYERTVLRPALTVNGLSGGHRGSGVKGVIPPAGTAKLSFRLVPDQEPDEIALLLRRHVAAAAPPAVSVRLRTWGGSNPVLVDPRHPAVAAAMRAYRATFPLPPALLRSGGSIAAVELFRRLLGIETVLMGFALADDRIHAPNERFRLETFRRGVATCVRFLDELGRAGIPAERLPAVTVAAR